MDADRAIAIIEAVLAPKALMPVQIQIIRGVLAGDSYQQIAATAKTERSESGYQLGYIKETGAQLWQALGQRLGTKVTKKNLAAVLLWYTKQPEFKLAMAARSQQATADWGTGGDRPVANREIDGNFYGREWELATLKQWCLEEGARTISIVGMGGMGKTTLAWEIAHQIAAEYDRTVWRSLLNLPLPSDLCADLLQFLDPQPLALPDSMPGQIELLIDCLTRNRCLLILDNVESILMGGDRSGRYLPGYEDYDRLLRSIAEVPHQSCVILTSREQPHTISTGQIVNARSVRLLNLGGIEPDWGHQLLQDCGCPPLPDWMWKEVYAHYGGNPLAFKLAAIGAIELTGGGEKVLELYPLMQQGLLPFRDIDDVLQRQFDRLSPLEQQLVYWLAIEREPVTGADLRANLVLNPIAVGEAINALQLLSRRCVTVAQTGKWSILPVMTTYATKRSIDLFVAELSSPPQLEDGDLIRQFSHLNRYAIVQAHTKDYLRQAQIQSILHPIRDRLLEVWGDREAIVANLRQIAIAWQTLDPIPPGYLAGNILNLAIELSPDRSLADWDFGALPIRCAYLAAANLCRVDFATATFERSVFTQAFGGVFYAIYDPTGELLATSDANGDISLWQIADGQRVAIFQGHTNWVRSLTFNADGSLLASSSEDRTLRIWDARTGAQVVKIGTHTHCFRGMLFSPDGTHLVSCSDDCAIRFYDLNRLLADVEVANADCHCDRIWRGHTNWVFSLTYSPDGRKLASASADGTVRIWEVETGECIRVLTHEHWTIRTLFSPDGRYLTVSGLSPNLYLWDLRSGEQIETLKGHQDWVWSIAMSADGRTVYSTGEDRTIRAWDLSSGKCQTVIRAHQRGVWTLAISPDGSQLVSGSEDRTIKFWDLHSNKCIKTIDGYGNWIKAVAFVPQKNWLASCHRDRTVRLWDLSTHQCISTLRGHTNALMTLAISPDGRYLASGSLGSTIRIWDLQRLVGIHTLAATAEGVCALAFSADGNKLISGNYRGDLQIWDTHDWNCQILPHPSRIEAVATCGVKRTIATACEAKIRIWDLDTGECLQTICAHYLNVLTVAFSPDGRYLASGSMDTTVKIWDTSTWECLHVFNNRQSWVTALAFSPDSERLMVGGGDREIECWQLATAEKIQTYTGHHNWIWSIACSPDGERIASASEDETIKVWEVESASLLHSLQLERPYERMNITGAIGLKSGQRQTLRLLGAIDE